MIELATLNYLFSVPSLASSYARAAVSPEVGRELQSLLDFCVDNGFHIWDELLDFNLCSSLWLEPAPESPGEFILRFKPTDDRGSGT